MRVGRQRMTLPWVGWGCIPVGVAPSGVHSVSHGSAPPRGIDHWQRCRTGRDALPEVDSVANSSHPEVY